MLIEHIAIWTHQLERLKECYIKYFNAKPNEKYTSTKDFDHPFESYFLSFDSGARLEIMCKSNIPLGDNIDGRETLGLTHLAFGVDSKEELDNLFQILKNDNQPIAGEPRTTGDGYYEACVLDPDGNRVEIAVVP